MKKILVLVVLLLGVTFITTAKIGAKMTVNAPDNYKELFEAFLKKFSLNKNKKYELYYYDDKKKK